MASKKSDIVFSITFDDKGSKKLNAILKKNEKALKKTATETKKVGKEQKKQTEETKKQAKGFEKLKSMMKSTWGQMAVGMGVTTLVTSGIRAIKQQITDTIQKGREFEKQWANVRTMLDENVVNQAKMKKSLMEMSSELGNTIDLTKALYQALSASVAPARALEFLAVASKSAIAGLASTETAVDAITTVMNSYKMGVDDATKISDVMFTTVKRGKLTFEIMSGALSTVTPIASQVGVTFEEIAGAMATMTKQGIDANTATMQLRQIMVAVLKPTKDASDMAKQLGIDFSASALKAKGLQKFLKEVQIASKGDAEALTALFGNVRSLSGVMALGGKSAQTFADDLEAMKNSAGATEEAFEKQTDTLDHWIRTVTNSMDKMKISIWEGFVQGFRGSFSTIEDFSKTLDELSKSFGEISKAVGYLVAVWTKSDLGKKLKVVADTLATIDSFKFYTLEKLKKGQIWKFLPTRANLGNAVTALQAFNHEQEEIERKAVMAKKGTNVFMFAMKSMKGYIASAGKALAKGGDAFDEWYKASGRSKVAMEEFELTGADLLLMMEELDVKGIRRTRVEFNDLRQKLLLLTQAGKLTKSETTKLAKEVVKMGEDINKKVSPHIRALAGDYLGLAEEAGTLNIVLDEQVTKLQGDFIPSWQKTKGSVLLVGKAMTAGVKYMWELAEASSRLGITLKSQLQTELQQTLIDFNKLADAKQLTPETTKQGLDKIFGYYKSLGKAVPLIYRMMYIKAEAEMKKHTKNASKEALKWLKKQAEAVSKLGQLIGLLGEEFEGAVGNLIGALGAGFEQLGATLESEVKDWGQLLINLVPIIGTIGGAIGEMIGGVKEGEQSFAKLGSSLGSTLGGLIPGAGIVGKAVGGLLGGLVGGLFKKQPKETADEKAERVLEASIKSLTKALSKFGKISENVAKAIAEDRKQMRGFLAVSKNFGDIIKDVGVSSENVVDLWERATEIIYHVNDGMLDASTGTKALNSAFEAMLNGARALGNEGSWQMINFIKTARDLGVEIPAVTEYVTEQLMKIPDALKSMIDNVIPNFARLEEFLKDGIINEDQFNDRIKFAERRLNDLAMVALGSFQAMINNGATYMQALYAMRDPLDALREKYKQLGIEAPVFMAPLFDLLDTMALKPRVFENMDNAMTILKALSNTGYMTQEMFTALAHSATQFAKAILGVEGNLNKNIKAMLENNEVTEAMKGAIMPIIMEFAKVAEMFQLDDVPSWMKKFVRSEMVDEEGNPMTWNKFQKEQTRMANAGVDTVDQLNKMRKHQIDMKSLLRDIRDNTKSSSTGAQHGFHGDVTGPRNFHVEAGRRERVDISPQGALTGHGGMAVQEKIVRITPVLISLEDQGQWILDFVQEASEDERLSIAKKSIKG